MSPLEEALGDYLRLRRSLGHKLDCAGRQLSRFVAYLDDIGQESVTLESVLGFVLDPDLDPASTVPGRRLTAVRGFARYLSGIDPATEIPPAGLVSCRTCRRNPYLFSDGDVDALARAARAGTPFPFRAATLSTLIGLLAATGLRVGEALRLGKADIDWSDGVLLVRETKFRKGRNVPLSATTVAALASYARLRDQARPAASRFFVSLAGTPVYYSNFALAFRRAVRDAGIGARGQIRPAIHDLRHSFAVRTLLGWYRAGRDVEALLPRLSTYLGHLDPRFTYRYLTASPELLGCAASRLEVWLAGRP